MTEITEISKKNHASRVVKKSITHHAAMPLTPHAANLDPITRNTDNKLPPSSKPLTFKIRLGVQPFF